MKKNKQLMNSAIMAVNSIEKSINNKDIVGALDSIKFLKLILQSIKLKKENDNN